MTTRHRDDTADQRGEVTRRSSSSRARRILIGFGAALLVGGWGTTRYADEQQQALDVRYTTSPRQRSLTPRRDLWFDSTRLIYAAGVVGMAIGAGVLAFALPRSAPSAGAG